MKPTSQRMQVYWILRTEQRSVKLVDPDSQNNQTRFQLCSLSLSRSFWGWSFPSIHPHHRFFSLPLPFFLPHSLFPYVFVLSLFFPFPLFLLLSLSSLLNLPYLPFLSFTHSRLRKEGFRREVHCATTLGGLFLLLFSFPPSIRLTTSVSSTQARSTVLHNRPGLLVGLVPRSGTTICPHLRFTTRRFSAVASSWIFIRCKIRDLDISTVWFVKWVTVSVRPPLSLFARCLRWLWYHGHWTNGANTDLLWLWQKHQTSSINATSCHVRLPGRWSLWWWLRPSSWGFLLPGWPWTGILRP